MTAYLASSVKGKVLLGRRRTPKSGYVVASSGFNHHDFSTTSYAKRSFYGIFQQQQHKRVETFWASWSVLPVLFVPRNAYNSLVLMLHRLRAFRQCAHRLQLPEKKKLRDGLQIYFCVVLFHSRRKGAKWLLMSLSRCKLGMTPVKNPRHSTRILQPAS